MPKNQTQALKIVPFTLCLLLAGGVLFLWAEPIGLSFIERLKLQGTPEERLVADSKADLQKLRRKNFIPKALDDLASVHFFSQDAKLQSIFETDKSIFQIKKNGKYNLEVFIDETEARDSVVIQYDLEEKKTGNTIWEMGRTYSFKR